MTALDESPADSAPIAGERPETKDASASRRGIAFWIVRYLPAEIVGTAALVLAGILVTTWTDSAALVALAALVGEIAGFYVVLAVTIYAEQAHVAPSWRSAVLRTGLLLVAEFGVAELLDTLVIRPLALMVGVWLAPDPMWGLLAGKIVADVVFYTVAAGAFTITAKTGLRGVRRSERPDAAAESAHPEAAAPVPPSAALAA